MFYKRLFLIVSVGSAMLLGAASIHAQGPQPQAAQLALGTGFTYQGQLKNAGAAVNGTCDFQFALYDAATLGARIGTTVTIGALAVTNGLFSTLLDFGTGALNGDARFLNIRARCPAGAGAYTALSPRQALTPAPTALTLPGLWTEQNATSPNLIGGFSGNVISPSVVGSTIGGGGASGFSHTINSDYSTIGGGYSNTVSSNAGTIGGGNNNTASGFASTVGGGVQNAASNNVTTVGGGQSNTASGSYAIVGGGFGNSASGIEATVGGGNSNGAGGDYATVGGGNSNGGSGDYAAVGGGYFNSASGNYATVGGGFGNSASGNYATVGGGDSNGAGGLKATVGGGYGNYASGNYATTPGGYFNVAQGGGSFAVGSEARALHNGAFVWSDGSHIGPISSTAANQFIVYAAGGFGLGSNNPQGPLHINSAAAPPAGIVAGNNGLLLGSTGDSTYKWMQSYGGSLALNPQGNYVGIGITNPLHLLQLAGGAYSDGATWSNGSDRNSKTNFDAVDPGEILAKLATLPIESWNYKVQDASIRHLGPMAQDFSAAFGLGADDTHIATVDEEGVALAAIQALNQRVQSQQDEIARLQAALDTVGHAARPAGATGQPDTLVLGLVGMSLAANLVLGVVLALHLRRDNRAG